MAEVSNSDLAGRLDIVCRKGDSFYREITFELNDAPMDFTGSTFEFEITKHLNISVLLVEEGVGLTIVANKVIIAITDETMNKIQELLDYKYTLKRLLTEDVITMLAGQFKVNPR